MKNIIIVGGGAAGLELLINLRNKTKHEEINILLVERSLSHIWKPLLHEVAAGTLPSDFNEIDYTTFVFKQGCEYVYGKCIAVDRKNKSITVDAVEDEEGNVLLPTRKLNYDILVLAVGSHANDFKIPGVLEYCSYIDSLKDAKEFHQKLLSNLIQQTQGFIHKKFKVAIIGGGATGVELAAEIQQVYQFTSTIKSKKTFSNLVEITVIEAADRLLSNLPIRISYEIKKQLESFNIRVLTQKKIIRVEQNHLLSSEGERIEFDLCVWAAGVKSRLEHINLDDLETNHLFQLKVFPTLQSINENNIFALGDCAACPDLNGKGNVPPRAQAAHQQASFLSRALINYLEGKPLKNYRYKDYGTLINLSQINAHGTLMGKLIGNFYLQGKIARWLYLLLYQFHLVKLHGVWRVFINNLANLFSRKSRSRLKLH